ncbi:MAG: alginate export family protein, partial [Pseudomonadota bacterium]
MALLRPGKPFYRGNVFWNWEAVYQFGDQGDLDIAAWTLATNTGYRWLDVPWEPEFL